MANVLIIGAGGVGRVVAHKCAQRRDVFDRICLASRSVDKCHRIRAALGVDMAVDEVNADYIAEVETLLHCHKVDVVVNAALPYQNLKIMSACLAGGAHYIDTAAPEIPGEIWSRPDDDQWYQSQWEYHELFRERGVSAVLGIGSDPGMVNVFCAYAARELFDEIRTIDIMDVNAGSHGYPFATNFNPEINLRELQSPSHYWENGQWHEVPPLSLHREFDFPGIGPQTLYSVDHDEIHSLYRHFPEAEAIRFWMGFSPEFIDYLQKLKAIGLLSHEPVAVATDNGASLRVVPLKVLEALLPDPASLGRRYSGKVCIGCLVGGVKDGREKRCFIYNLTDHQEAYQEVGAQAISYTAGVPAAVAAVLVAQGDWRRPGVANVEQLDPLPFLELMPAMGMAWQVREEG